MQTQTIFQVGNSNAVTIPSYLMKDLKLKKGQKVTVEKTPDENAVIIKAVSSKIKPAISTTGLTPEFKDWLDNIEEKESDIIKALAKV
jgi:antitoxin component of MazEF toxin-antitoxin module